MGRRDFLAGGPSLRRLRGLLGDRPRATGRSGLGVRKAATLPVGGADGAARSRSIWGSGGAGSCDWFESRELRLQLLRAEPNAALEPPAGEPVIRQALVSHQIPEALFGQAEELAGLRRRQQWPQLLRRPGRWLRLGSRAPRLDACASCGGGPLVHLKLSAGLGHVVARL